MAIETIGYIIVMAFTDGHTDNYQVLSRGHKHNHSDELMQGLKEVLTDPEKQWTGDFKFSKKSVNRRVEVLDDE